ncbi:hypothetical protein [Actinomadura rudentiformis]|nr:hypothetical protein [Actinomadura rudentiformis]
MTRTFSRSAVVAVSLTVAGSMLAGCGAQSLAKNVSAAGSPAKAISVA